jgi:hypothetical protein
VLAAFVDRSHGGKVTIKRPKLGLFALALASAGYAQTSRPDAGAATQPADVETPSGLLAGPRVSDDGDDSNTAFGGRQRGQRAVPVREWFRVLDGLRLDPQQQAEINRIRRELRRAWQASRAARREGEDARPSGGSRAGGPEAVAPVLETFQKRIWMLLDDTQQATMRAELAEVRTRIARRRAERMATEPGDDVTPPTGGGDVGLDEAGRRRLAFLRARQTRRRAP